MSESNLVQLYWAILERWGAQVDSYWTRTNYFALFVTAAIGGTWVVLDDQDITKGHRYFLFAADFAVVLAIVLTAAWIFSNLKSYDYHMYWWSVLEKIEKSNGWTSSDAPDYVSAYEMRRKQRRTLSIVPYHFFTNWFVPIAFFIFWVSLVIGLVVHRWN